MCHKGWIPYHQITRARTYTLWATDIGAYNVDIDLYRALPFYMDVRRGGAGASMVSSYSTAMVWMLM
jgi:hypothetical protein